MSNTQEFKYHPREEQLNIISHALGIALALFGGFLLYQKVNEPTVKSLFSIGVYIFSLVFLYSASTAYHSAKKTTQREALRKVDHMAIFVLIAGSYTPFALMALPANFGNWFFGIIWVLAIIGSVLKLFFTGRWEKLSTAMYVSMGWSIVFAIGPLIDAISWSGFWWLLAGGLFYSAGAILYLFDQVRYTHFAFHVTVLMGSILQFIAIYQYIV